MTAPVTEELVPTARIYGPGELPDRYRWLGLLAFLFYSLHAGYFLVVGRPSHLLWGCHIAALGVGCGLLFKNPTFNAMGVVALFFGTPMWIIDFTTGGEFLPTSMGTHFGGLALGLFALRYLGLPRWTWTRCAGFTVLLIVICRLVTLEKANVNLSFAPPKGWEQYFPPYPAFGAVVMVVCTSTFFTAELVLGRLIGIGEPSEPGEAPLPAPA